MTLQINGAGLANLPKVTPNALVDSRAIKAIMSEGSCTKNQAERTLKFIKRMVSNALTDHHCGTAKTHCFTDEERDMFGFEMMGVIMPHMLPETTPKKHSAHEAVVAAVSAKYPEVRNVTHSPPTEGRQDCILVVHVKT